MSSEHEVEARLVALFERQAASVPPRVPSWTDVAAATPPPGGPRLRTSRVLAAACVVLVAAAIAALVVVHGSSSSDIDREPSVRADIPAAEPRFQAKTTQVSLDARALRIDVGGRTFRGDAPLLAHSDPGDATSTTLELTWQEHEVQMRLFMYFTSDGRDWWSDEIRTYDGNADGEWITYTGEYFRTRLGRAFAGDLDLTASDHGIDGRLRLADLHLEAFRRPAACDTAPGRRVLAPFTDRIDMVKAGPDWAFAIGASVLDTSSCVELSSSDYRFTWTADDPRLVQVTADGAEAYLQATRPGRTTLHVSAEDRSTGEVLDDVRIEVVVAG